MTRWLILLGLVISLGAGGAANAASITWSTPVTETGEASDIVTSGTLLVAETISNTATVGGVTFDGGFSGDLTITNGISSYCCFSSAFSGGYGTLTSQLGYTNSTPLYYSIVLSGLTAGDHYEVQIVEPFNNTDYATIFTAGGSASQAVQVGDIYTPSDVIAQYVTGTFVADGSTETISATPPIAGNYVILGAVQVRELAAPESASWVMMLIGGALVGAALRTTRAGRRLAGG